MKPATINMLRAWLLTASLAAIVIDAAALLLIDVFGISEDVFTSTAFRAGAAVAITCIAWVMRRRVDHVPQRGDGRRRLRRSQPRRRLWAERSRAASPTTPTRRSWVPHGR